MLALRDKFACVEMLRLSQWQHIFRSYVFFNTVISALLLFRSAPLIIRCSLYLFHLIVSYRKHCCFDTAGAGIYDSISDYCFDNSLL